MSRSEVLTQAGEYVLDEATIAQANGVSLDVKNQVDKIFFHEDIFSPFASGRVIFRDTVDIPGLLGRSGRDLLKLRILTPSLDKTTWIDGLFFIYKMSDRLQLQDRTQGYTLHFFSVEKLNDLEQISRTFQGSPSEICTRILTQFLKTEKQYSIEDTKNTIRYTSNFWTPSQNLSYAVEHGVSRSNQPDLLFFENRAGFNLASLDTLLRRPIAHAFQQSDFIAKTKTEGVNVGVTERDPIEDYRSIIDFRVHEMYDYIKSVRSGALKSNLVYYDPVLKKYTSRPWDASTSSRFLANGFRHFRNDVIAATPATTLTTSKVYGANDYGDSTNTRYLQSRISTLHALKGARVEIDVYGRTDYTVGMKVFLSMNKNRRIIQSDDSADYIDKMYTGQYIVTAILHGFEKTGHICTLELSKESTTLE